MGAICLLDNGLDYTAQLCENIFISVTLKVGVTNKTNLNFQSLAHYCASNEGRVILSKDAPINHYEYDNPDSMGIFWSMRPLPNSDVRFWSSSVADGLFCSFYVYEGNSSNTSPAC